MSIFYVKDQPWMKVQVLSFALEMRRSLKWPCLACIGLYGVSLDQPLALLSSQHLH